MVNNLLIPWTGTQIFDDSGDPLAAGKLYIYLEDTTTLASIYTDRDLTSGAANPIILDADGRSAPRFIGEVPYKIKGTTSADVTVFEHDDLPGALAVSSSSGSFAAVDSDVETKTANYTVVEADLGKTINVNVSGGSRTITLPSAITATNGRGITIRHITSGSANTVTIATVSAQTIIWPLGSGTTMLLTGYGESVEIRSDGANWHAVGWSRGYNLQFKAVPGVDSFVFYDQSELAVAYGTVGNGLEISGTTVQANIASAAEQEAASDSTTLVASSLQHRHPGHPKTWAMFSTSGTPSISTSYGMSSITDHGTGQFTANFTTAFSSTSYGCFGSCSYSAVGSHPMGFLSSARGTGGARFYTYAGISGVQDMVYSDVLFVGDHA